jgi:hypothetical protein
VGGDGGSMMATPPLPGAPFGKILLGTKRNPSKPYWEAQNLQPVVDITTDWLAVGHVDEVLMWVATNKVLYASPWKAADLLHQEIAAGQGTNTIWAGFVNDSSKVKTIESVVMAPKSGGGFKQDVLPSPGLTASATTFTFPANVFAVNDRLRVDDEILVVTTVNGNTLTITRANGGRPADAHAAGAVIYAFSDLMMLNLPIGPTPDYENSAVVAIETVLAQLTAACSNQVPDLIPMPVLFAHHPDPMSPGLVATTSNPVNCLLALGGVIRYSQTGCTVFEQYIQTMLPGAVPEPLWFLHCNFGEFHCGTATIRSVPANPTWWKIKTNWD